MSDLFFWRFETEVSSTFDILLLMMLPARKLFLAQLCCGFFSIFLCMMPHFLSWQLKFPEGQASEMYPIVKAICSKEYLLSLVSSASMSFHMIVDIFGHSLFSKGYIYSYRNFYSKILIILFLLTPDLVQLFIVIPNLDYYSFFLFRYIRYLTFCMVTFLYLTHCGGNIWRSYIPLNGLIAILSGFILKYYLYFLDTNSFSSLVPIALCLQAIGTLLTGLCTYRWCRKLYRNKAEGKRMTSDQYCCNIYLLGFWIVCIALWFQTIYNNFPIWYNTNTSMAVEENCFFTVYYILITVFEGHAVLMEAITSQVTIAIIKR